MKLAKLLLISTLISFGFTAAAQTDTSLITRAVSSLAKRANTNPTEKVYLHLNRPNYSIGDTIWFKAYTVIGEHHQLSNWSGVLYAELISEKDSVVKRLTLKLTSGLAWGDIALIRNYKPGLYHLRAYTNWMRNAGTAYFYNQQLRINGAQSAVKVVKKSSPVNPDVQFFPEGGTLVNGVRSKIAVKAMGASGLGEDIKGTVTDNDGNEVAEFATQHLGMGIFALTPVEGKTYKAKITGSNGEVFSADLPKADAEGFTLGVNNSQPDSVFVKIAVNNKLFATRQNSTFYLVAQSNGKIYFASQGTLASPVFTSRIEKSRLPSGIVQFTVFAQNGEPMNERIAFIRNNDSVNLALSSAVSTFSPRQKVTVDVNAKTPDGQQSVGIYSVSVINESRSGFDAGAESTIFNNLLLTSDLKGYIEKPNYYFSNDQQAKADLDVLMLTQGYRRFEWKRVLSNNSAAPAYQPERSLELLGALKTPSGKPVPNGKVRLVSTRDNFITDTTTNINGDYKFTNLYLPDTAKIILRARKEHNGSNVTIYVKQKDFPAIIKEAIVPDEPFIAITPEMQLNIDEYRAQMRKDSIKNGVALKEIVIKGKRVSKPDIYNNYGTSLEREIDMKRFHDYNDMNEALRYVLNANPREKHAVVIDGMIYHPDVSVYRPAEIESVRVIDGRGRDSGYIVISTKRFAGTDTTVLKQVTINAKRVKKGPDLSNSSNLNGPGNADQVIMGDKVGGCVKLSDCLQGKVFGVTFRNGTPYSIRAQGRLTGDAAMVVIVDGVQLEGSALDDLNANDVYSIEVLRSGANMAIYGSSLNGAGALVITTKRGGDPNYVTSQSPSGLITYPFQGFYKARSFYSPKYSSPASNSVPTDIRSTIYWNPNILTGKDGKASFEYFNDDTKGTYRVVIEGIDDNGNLGRQVYRYKVE